MGWKRKTGIGCGIVALLLAAAIGAALYFGLFIPGVHVAEPGPTGRRVSEDGLLANYLPARGARAGPAILVLGGSEGGIGRGTQRTATALQAQGFSVLALSYHRAPGQPPHLEEIPLEYFGTALAWLRRQPEVDPGRVGILGVSKGAEAALLVATRDPEIAAVVAALPSSIVWQGASFDRSGEFDSSWSEQGRPLEHVRYGRWKWWREMTPILTEALEAVPADSGAFIPVERAEADVLLVCGEADSLWPSCPMARQVEARANERGGPQVTLLAYPEAGHAAFGQPLEGGDPGYSQLDMTGGTDAGNNRARGHGWPRVVAFLRSALEPTPRPSSN